MPLSQDDKDEIRLLIAMEIKNAIRHAISAVVNMPIELTDVQYAMTPDGRQEREERQKVAKQIGKAILDSAEETLREADARIVEKTDPERADRIRKFKPTF